MGDPQVDHLDALVDTAASAASRARMSLLGVPSPLAPVHHRRHDGQEEKTRNIHARTNKLIFVIFIKTCNGGVTVELL